MSLNEYLPDLGNVIKEGNAVILLRLGYSVRTTIAVTPDALRNLAKEKVRIVIDEKVRKSLESAVRNTVVDTSGTGPQDVRLGIQFQNEGGLVLHDFYIAPHYVFEHQRAALIDGNPAKLRGGLIAWSESLLDKGKKQGQLRSP